jgi:hypothetical protein
MKDRNVKNQVILRGGDGNEESKEGEYCKCVFYECMCEYGTLKPFEAILRRGMGQEGE